MPPVANPAGRQPGGDARRPGRALVQRLALWEVMLLTAAAGFGLWLALPSLRDGQVAPGDRLGTAVVVGVAGLFGGTALLGPPLLLAELRRGRRNWGPGKLLWFAGGTSAWLLWPPVVYRRTRGAGFTDATSGYCFAYGTPLMALYVTAALLAGGAFGRAGRRKLRRSWREAFGLLLGLAWACTGLYVLTRLYETDFNR